MSKVIYKYELAVVDYQQIGVPINSQILAIQTQFIKTYNPLDDGLNELPYIWILIDENEYEQEVLRLRTIGTGHPIYDDSEVKEYLGTYQLKRGALVFHVFRL